MSGSNFADARYATTGPHGGVVTLGLPVLGLSDVYPVALNQVRFNNTRSTEGIGRSHLCYTHCSLASVGAFLSCWVFFCVCVTVDVDMPAKRFL